MGIDIPILIGGAALTKSFVNDFVDQLLMDQYFTVVMLLMGLFLCKELKVEIVIQLLPQI